MENQGKFSILLVLVTICCICQTNVSAALKDTVFRRWLHGCHMMFPCPPPFCNNPVFDKYDCCGHCPAPSPAPTGTQTTINDNKTTHNKTSLLENSLTKRLLRVQRLLDRWTPPPTRSTTTFCPYPCTHQGTHFCYPLPCHITCVDAVKPPGGCCYVCQNGPNCGYNGHVIPEGKFITGPSGEEIHCTRGGYDGGSIIIRQTTTLPSTVARI